MQTKNNLSYEIKINYKNNLGLDVEIYAKISKTGLEEKTIQVGDTRITEETTKGRVLSGRYDKNDITCGYRYDKYEENNSEEIFNINENIPLNTAVDLIEKIKKQKDFSLAKHVLIAIMHNDYNSCWLEKIDNLHITKTILSKDNNKGEYSFQEILNLAKSKDDKFIEISKNQICKIDDKPFKLDNEVDRSEDNNKLKMIGNLLKKKITCYEDLILASKTQEVTAITY